jgi:hypothetical protein
MTSEGAQRSYIFTDVRGHPTAPAFPHIDISTRLVSTATQLLRCRSRAPEQLLETYAPRLMLDEGMVDLGSNWSCYRELHGNEWRPTLTFARTSSMPQGIASVPFITMFLV